MTGFDLEITSLAAEELKGIRLFDRRRILEEIHRQLERQPTVITRN
jgi:hypothetical protein